MVGKRTCEECGAELPANAPQGLCPRCLANMGLGLLPTVALPKSDFQVERAGTMIGRYKLLEKIGEGGFGVVFMAEQVEPVQRKVALKIIKAGMDTREVIARFEAERQAIALMDHPNIARALDAGATEAGRPYFVMELVRGIPITDYCDQANLPTHERLQLFMRVCQAVQHAHQKGVIHRDLKPTNVLVTDFGVAKALGQKLTEKTLFTGFQHMIGTPAYMSPEQAALSGLDIDTRADIYSLGVLLYELLTGVTPFDTEVFRKAALDEIRRMIRETEPPKPSTRLQTLGEKITEVAKHRHTEPAALSRLVRGDLDWIVMKCLEKDRQRRYDTANGLASDVARHLNNEPVVARPPSNLYRFQKLVRRHRLVFAASGSVTAALILGLGLSTRLFLEERVAHQRAVAAEQEAESARANETKLRLRAEANGKIGEIRLLLAQDEFEKAENLFKQVDPALLQDWISAVGILDSLGDWHASRGEWQEALLDYKKLIALVPADDWKLISWGNSLMSYHAMMSYHAVMAYHALAPLLVQSGDLEGYRQHCLRSLAQFTGTKEPLIADKMAKDCLIVPCTGVDMAAVGEWADTAVTAGKDDAARPYFQCTKALAEYRLGRFESSARWSREALLSGEQPWHDYPHVEAYMVLAMASFCLNRPEEARSSLARGDEIARSRFPAKAHPTTHLVAKTTQGFLPHRLESGTLGSEWRDWIIAHALMREAKALIEGESKTSNEAKTMDRLRKEAQ